MVKSLDFERSASGFSYEIPKLMGFFALMFGLPRRCLRKVRIPRSKQPTRRFTVLGIETSCDDSCVSVLDIDPQSAPRIRHNIVRRSLNLSEPHGGIVPNIVAMFHVNALGNALSEVRDAGGFKNIDLIAVTRGNFQFRGLFDGQDLVYLCV